RLWGWTNGVSQQNYTTGCIEVVGGVPRQAVRKTPTPCLGNCPIQKGPLCNASGCCHPLSTPPSAASPLSGLHGDMIECNDASEEPEPHYFLRVLPNNSVATS